MCLGVPGQIVEITDSEQGVGLVNISGVKREVYLNCVLEQNSSIDELIGRWVLVHVGFAMSLIDEEEAEKTLQLLAELGELQTELEQLQHSVADEV